MMLDWNVYYFICEHSFPFVFTALWIWIGISIPGNRKSFILIPSTTAIAKHLQWLLSASTIRYDMAFCMGGSEIEE